MIASSWVKTALRVSGLACACLWVCAITAAAQAPVKFDSSTISGLSARNIGSAKMSGRIAAVDAINEHGQLTVFAAAASGGVWKSINGGTTFKSVFDKPDVQSIGEIGRASCRERV